MSAIAFDEIDALALAGGRYGKIDLACPLCGPRCKSPINRKRKTLRIWRDDDDFARFYCARCGAHGYSRDDKATKADPSEYLRRRAEAERRDAEDEQSRIRSGARDLEPGGADRGHPRGAVSDQPRHRPRRSARRDGARPPLAPALPVGGAALRPAWSRCGPTPSPPSRRASTARRSPRPRRRSTACPSAPTAGA